MAEFSIEEAIARLMQLPDKIGREGAEIMRGEVPVKEGGLRGSITYEVIGSEQVAIFTEIHYAKYVEYGRGEVRPKRAKALHWDDVFAMRSGPTKPNDFVGRTANQLRGRTFSL